MKKYLLNLVVFVAIGIVAGEVIVRVFNLTVDVPKSYKADDGLVRYFPNQKGNYKNASHSWEINKYGYSGKAPESFDNLIVIHGDSYIENFMNPVSCHQNVYLKEFLPQYNFFEASRAGATILELLEQAKQVDTLQPKAHLLYIKDNDFTEAIAGLDKNIDHVRVDLNKNKLIFSKYKGSALKDALYNFKFAYYIYRNIWLKGGEEGAPGSGKSKAVPYDKIGKLIDYIKGNYDLNRRVLVFSPNSDLKIISMCEKAGFKIYSLTADDFESWRLEDDSHWSCYGHEEAAKQVKGFITDYLKGSE